eukprot:comp21855_c0_seq1/m.31232 comp21855_c0_seq1/g.31232  ORF comp21855_c0_seq1/g.31232 comp21855_c0_seq1/m.31232 type:complete len:506 (-) comp21855_c0_seq1:451-1968(-)
MVPPPSFGALWMGRRPWVLPDKYWQHAVRLVGELWFAMLGNVIEWYEFNVYGYVAAQIDVNFFHGNSTATWAAFALPFVLRPLGAIFFGWLADTKGRRIALLSSLLGMIIATVGQGLCPSVTCCEGTVAQVGMVLFLLLRGVQGFCCGGEVGPLSTHLAESDRVQMLGFLAAMNSFGAYAGGMVASAIAAILTSALTPDQMMVWGWRIPFIVSIVPGVIGFYGRASLKETVVFEQHQLDLAVDEENRITKTQESDTQLLEPISSVRKEEFNTKPRVGIEISHDQPSSISEAYPIMPFLEVCRNNPVQLLILFLSTSISGVCVYIGGPWVVTFTRTYGSASPDLALWGASMSTVASAITGIFLGVIVDIQGVGWVEMVGSAFTVPLVLLLWVVITAYRYNAVVCYVCVILLGVARATSGNAVLGLWMAEMFPTHARASGFVAYHTSMMLFGGLGPMTVTAIANNFIYGPAIFVTAMSFLGACVIAGSYVGHCRGRVVMATIRPEPY